MEFKEVSQRRQKVYIIPTDMGMKRGPTARAVLMGEVKSKSVFGECCVCGQPLKSGYSFTECDKEQIELLVGGGCFHKCHIEGE